MKKNSRAGYQKSSGISINMFTDDELYALHLSTLEILKDVGMGIKDPVAQETLASIGCKVNKDKNVVRFPAYVVEDAILKAPASVVFAGRNPAKDYVLEDNRVGFTNFGEGIMINDLYTGEHRPTVKSDTAQAALMADWCSAIDIHERSVAAQDTPAIIAPLHETQVNITNTSKHVTQGCGNVRNLRRAHRMMCHIAGSEAAFRERPIFSTITCPISPLQLAPESTELIMECARMGMPITIISMALAGGTTPVTLAGTLITHNAEVLAAIVLSQATCPGAPIVYGSSTTIMDLRYTTSPVGCPELAMINAGVAKLAQFYHLPSWVAGG
jgi:trimethylamine--corrinoid protein Co-methyltransferase